MTKLPGDAAKTGAGVPSAAEDPRGGGLLPRVFAAGKQAWKLIGELRSLPALTVHLMFSKAAENEEFFRRYTLDHYRDTQRRHRRFPLVKALEYGFSVKILEDKFEDYFMSLEGSARRNFKGAVRKGFVFERIDYNEHLEDIREILRSTPYRQGRMPEHLVLGAVKPVDNPPSRNAFHDYPFYGVLRNGVVHAYAGCFVAGEICMIETIYGHAEHHSDGVVPLLIISIVKDLLENYPQVRYYSYGTMYGASQNLRRFKRKFRFLPMRVRWELE